MSSAAQPPSSATQDQPGGGEELLTTREVMAFLNLSRTRIWELVKREQLPAFKVGGDYRYRRSEIDAWLERFRVNHAPVHHEDQK